MSLYFFRISQGRYSGAADQPYECASRESAWSELTSVCADLIGGISRSLQKDAEWRMELLDEAKQPGVPHPSCCGVRGVANSSSRDACRPVVDCF